MDDFDKYCKDQDSCSENEKILATAYVCVIVLFFTCLAVSTYNEEPKYYTMEDQEVFGGYHLPMYTKEYQIKFYVKSEDVFNQRYPPGTPARADIEDEINTKYVDRVQANCEYKLFEWYSRLPDFSTTFCDKFKSFGKYEEVGLHQVLQHPDFVAFLKKQHLKDGINQVLQRPDSPDFLKDKHQETGINQVLQRPEFPALLKDS